MFVCLVNFNVALARIGWLAIKTISVDSEGRGYGA